MNDPAAIHAIQLQQLQKVRSDQRLQRGQKCGVGQRVAHHAGALDALVRLHAEHGVDVRVALRRLVVGIHGDELMNRPSVLAMGIRAILGDGDRAGYTDAIGIVEIAGILDLRGFGDEDG